MCHKDFVLWLNLHQITNILQNLEEKRKKTKKKESGKKDNEKMALLTDAAQGKEKQNHWTD